MIKLFFETAVVVTSPRLIYLVRDFVAKEKPSLIFISEKEVSEAEKSISKINDHEILNSNNINDSCARLSCYISNNKFFIKCI